MRLGLKVHSNPFSFFPSVWSFPTSFDLSKLMYDYLLLGIKEFYGILNILLSMCMDVFKNINIIVRKHETADFAKGFDLAIML